MERKYEFTGEIKELSGHTLHRIRALRDFGEVKAGTIGGWIEKEENLSHEGLCWVSDEAQVFGDAWVYGNTRFYGNATVDDNTWDFGKDRISENRIIKGGIING